MRSRRDAATLKAKNMASLSAVGEPDLANITLGSSRATNRLFMRGGACCTRSSMFDPLVSVAPPRLIPGYPEIHSETSW